MDGSECSELEISHITPAIAAIAAGCWKRDSVVEEGESVARDIEI